MSEFDSEGPSENEWEERGDLAWNEFDWERYLRAQDDAVQRYLGHYETLRRHPDRIDEIARRMGWEESAEDDAAETAAPADDAFPPAEDGWEPYTFCKNPVFVATKALCLGLAREWELLAGDPAKAPPALALAYLASLHRCEEQAVLAVQALELGDYAMAISLFKRALAALNHSLALLDERAVAPHRQVARYREDALPRIFDLREIWLRVMSECREELGRGVDEEN